MSEKPKQDNRMLAVGIALAAAACLIYASFTRHWLVNISSIEDRGVGLRSNYSCVIAAGEAGCLDMTNSELVEELHNEQLGVAQQTSGAFMPMGWVTFVASLVAAFGLIAAAGIALAKKTPDLPMTPSTIALLGVMTTLITGMVFIATKPGPPGYVGVGISFWVFAGGAIGGIVAAQMLAKVNRPIDPDLMADSMNPDNF
jgi:hypothetical protein